ncbi:MAG: hypothetical protein GY847_12900 [Proteobacteria bacterium]|nr:hypothetical protein [Pseudomonadota bacterium]
MKSSICDRKWFWIVVIGLAFLILGIGCEDDDDDGEDQDTSDSQMCGQQCQDNYVSYALLDTLLFLYNQNLAGHRGSAGSYGGLSPWGVRAHYR